MGRGRAGRNCELGNETLRGPGPCQRPSLVLSAKAAQNFALAIHELATNAAKYGALSTPAGRVYISWSIAKTNGSGQFTFRWQERGGPAVSSPTQKGFGSAVLEQVMAEYFDVPPRIDFASGGVSYELSGSLDLSANRLSLSIRAKLGSIDCQKKRRFHEVIQPTRYCGAPARASWAAAGRSRLLWGGNSYNPDLAERYGWINRTLPAKVLWEFVSALKSRIAKFPPEGHLWRGKGRSFKAIRALRPDEVFPSATWSLPLRTWRALRHENRMKKLAGAPRSYQLETANWIWPG